MVFFFEYRNILWFWGGVWVSMVTILAAKRSQTASEPLRRPVDLPRNPFSDPVGRPKTLKLASKRGFLKDLGVKTEDVATLTDLTDLMAILKSLSEVGKQGCQRLHRRTI